MKKLLTIAAVSALALSTLSAGETYTRQSAGKSTYTPAPMEHEAKGGLYVAIFGGVNVAQTGDIQEENVGGIIGEIDTEVDTEIGWFGGLKLGYVFPTRSVLKPVIEVEGFYNGVETKFDTDTDFGNFDVNADFHSAVFMVNALLKFDFGKFQPYLGGGIGYAHTWINNVEVNDVEVEEAEDDEGTLAYQGIAGLEYHINEQIGVFTEYKALVFDEVGGIDTYVNHLIGVGVRVGF